MGRDAVDDATGGPQLACRCLVIVDDLWEMASFRALDMVKPPGRLLFTTRDAEIVRGAYAIPREVLELEPRPFQDVGTVQINPAKDSTNGTSAATFNWTR